MTPRVRRLMALYAPSLVLIAWAVVWALGLRNDTSDIVTLATLAAAAGIHTYEEIRSRKRRRRRGNR